MLGFVTPVEITSTSSHTLLPAETNAIAYKMVVPNSGGKEYFLFENRQAIGFDQGLQRFGTHGLAIYHVDDTVFTRNYTLADFVAGVESGVSAQPTFRTALQTQRICEAVLESAKTGHWVETGVEL